MSFTHLLEIEYLVFVGNCQESLCCIFNVGIETNREGPVEILRQTYQTKDKLD